MFFSTIRFYVVWWNLFKCYKLIKAGIEILSLLNFKHACQECNNRPMLHNMPTLISALWCFVGFRHSISTHLQAHTYECLSEGQNEIDRDKNPPPVTSQGEWSHLVDFSPRAYHSNRAAFTTRLIIIHILCARAP